MGQAAALVINDGQATPVATTFSPEKVTPDLSTFADRTSGIGLAYRRIRLAFSPATAQRTWNKTSYEVAIPVTQVVSGITSVAFTLRGKLEFQLPDGCTDAQRKDLHAFMVNGLSNTLIRGNLRDLDPLY